MKTKISVLLIFYNDEPYLSKSIESILNQTFNDFELIMFDNGSTDGSYEVAHNYAKNDSRIKIIRSKTNYHNGSLNFRKLLAHATGEYLRLFCADDIMLPDCLKNQVEFLDNNKNYIACFAHMKSIDDDGRLLKSNYDSTQKDNRYEYLNHIFYSNHSFAFPTAMVRQKMLKPEMLDPRLIHFSDVKLWIELLKKGDIHVIDQYLVQYRIRKNQGNVSNISEDRARLRSYLFETQLLYDEFFNISDFKEFLKIFPEARKYTDKLNSKKDHKLLPFITAILLYNSDQLKPFHFGLRRNIALLKIFEIIKDEELMSIIKKKLGYDYLTLYKFTTHFCDGIDIDYSRRKRNFIHEIWYKLVTRKKYKKLTSQM